MYLSKQIKALDESQLNPTCTRKISLLLHLSLGFASASGNNKDILLVVGFNIANPLSLMAEFHGIFAVLF